MKAIKKVDLKEAFRGIEAYWSPHVAAALNGQHVKLAKLKGEFVWHHHEAEDELFLVVQGQLIIKLCNQEIILEEGELLVVPRGVEHKPVAHKEAHVLLFEPSTTINTGNVRNERTRDVSKPV